MLMCCSAWFAGTSAASARYIEGIAPTSGPSIVRPVLWTGELELVPK